MSDQPNKPPFDRDKEICTEIISSANKLSYPMQEAVFVRELLPLLAGEETNVDLSFWLTRVGSYYTPIHVYRGQEFLFEVPPLLDNSNTGAKPAVSDQDSIFEDVITAQNKTHNSPNAGSVYIQEALLSRSREDVPDTRLSYATRVNAILARYNKPLIDPALGTTLDKGCDKEAQQEAPTGHYDDPENRTYDELSD